MRFELLTGGHDQVLVEAEGIPPNANYPDFFVGDDGWTYPAASVVCFRPTDEEL